MKKSGNTVFLFFLAAFFATGCSDFYHLKYSKLKKIPATGEISSFIPIQKKAGAKQNNFSAVVKEEKIVVSDMDSVHIHKNIPVVPRKIKERKHRISCENFFPGRNSVSKKSSERNFHHEKDHHVIIILGFLFLGALLFGYGVGVFLLAFIAPTILLSAVCVIAGIALFLLGLLPVFGLISMIIGDRFQSSEKRFEEKSKKKM